MKNHSKEAFAIGLAGIWIGVNEFIRNQVVFLSDWMDIYTRRGDIFPGFPANSVVWIIWSLSLAYLIFVLHKKFSVYQTVVIAWASTFIMMWMALANLDGLPTSIIPVATIWSILEVAVAVVIIDKLSK
jgi:hypothetical protein